MFLFLEACFSRCEVSLSALNLNLVLSSSRKMQRHGRNCLIPGDCFIVCDTGFTVDLTSYHADTCDSLVIKTVGYATRGICVCNAIEKKKFFEKLKKLNGTKGC